MLIPPYQCGLRVRDERIVSIAASTGNASRYGPCVDCVLSTHAWKARNCPGAESQCEQKAGNSTHRKYSHASNVPRPESRKTSKFDEADAIDPAICQCEMQLPAKDAAPKCRAIVPLRACLTTPNGSGKIIFSVPPLCLLSTESPSPAMRERELHPRLG